MRAQYRRYERQYKPPITQGTFQDPHVLPQLRTQETLNILTEGMKHVSEIYSILEKYFKL